MLNNLDDNNDNVIIMNYTFLACVCKKMMTKLKWKIPYSADLLSTAVLLNSKGRVKLARNGKL